MNNEKFLAKGAWKYKLAVVVRSDVEMTSAKLAVQVSHACVACVMMHPDSQLVRDWYVEGQRKVILQVKNLEELKKVMVKAGEHHQLTQMVVDAGLTELESGTVTCLGIGPAEQEKIDKITGNLRLYRSEKVKI